jgi:hypothetical protein
MKVRNILRRGKGKIFRNILYIPKHKPIVFKQYDVPKGFPKRLVEYLSTIKEIEDES